MQLIELWTNLHIFSPQDTIEIVVITCGIYKLSCWLVGDRQTNLLPYFYGYALLFICSYYLETHTLTLLLGLSFPVAALSFFLIHAHTLQKNFIALKKTTPETITANKEWLSTFMRSALQALNHGKSVFAIFENSDSLATFLHCQLPVNAPVQSELLETLFKSTAYHAQAMVWLTIQGKLIGFNTVWNYELDATWLCASAKELEVWKQQALFITAKTDAFFFHIEPTSRLCTIIKQGKSVERLRLEPAITILSSYIGTSVTSEKGDFTHAHQQTRTSEQRTS